MGKKKTKGGYNDFTEDTRYSNTNNTEIRTSLQSTSTLTRNISPPAPSKPQAQRPNNAHNKGKPKKPPLTHFLCLPLITSTNRPRISTALDKLRKDVASYTSVPPKAVRPVGTLHLTLGVMSLSSSQLSDATQYLRELDIGQLLQGITTQTVASEACDMPMVSEGFDAVENAGADPIGAAINENPGSLVIKLQGLVPMQRPRQTSILYAEPRDESGRLGRLAESLRRVFEERAWIVKDERGLKLHATVLNTIYAKPKGRGRGKGKEKASLKAAAMEGVEEKEGEVDGDDGQEQQGTDGEAGKEERKEKKDGHGADAKSWMRFDASSLIEVYEDFIWAEDVRIDRVQICKMGAKKILSEETGEVVDEEYEVVAEKRL